MNNKAEIHKALMKLLRMTREGSQEVEGGWISSEAAYQQAADEYDTLVTKGLESEAEGKVKPRKVFYGDDGR